MQTELTASQITKLTAIANGAPVGRAATKEKALDRFARALADRIGENRVARDLRPILEAPGFEVAEGELIAAIDYADAEEQARATVQTDDGPVLPEGEPEAADEAAALLAIVAAGKAKAEKATAKAAKPKADGPRPGTRARNIFDMLTSAGGATSKEMKEAGLGDVSIAIYAQPFADKYGFTVRKTTEGRAVRWELIPA